MDSFIYTSPSNSLVARLAVLGLDISKLHDLVLLFIYYESIGIKLEICSRMIVNKGKVVKAGRVDHIGEHQKNTKKPSSLWVGLAPLAYHTRQICQGVSWR